MHSDGRKQWYSLGNEIEEPNFVPFVCLRYVMDNLMPNDWSVEIIAN